MSDAREPTDEARPRPRPRPGPQSQRSQPAPHPRPASASAGRAEVSTSDDVPVELIDPDDMASLSLTKDTDESGSAKGGDSDAARRARHAAKHASDEPTTPPADAPAAAAAPPVPTAAADADSDGPDGSTGGSEKAPRKRRVSGRIPSVVLRTVIVLVVAAVVAFLLRAFVVQPFYIPSASMEPTLHGCTGCTDDHVLVDKLSYRFEDVHAGDIVVFHRPKDAQVTDSILVKRVIALAGDTVSLRKNSKGAWDGKVYVNGLVIDESYVNKKCKAPATVPLTGTSSWKIPPNDVFVMGDNRCDSEDSRAFGPIATSSIIGKVVLIIWPLSRFGTVK